MRIAQLTTLALATLLLLPEGNAQSTTYTGPNSSNSDVWNNVANWDNGIPSGSIDVVIPDGKHATAWSDSTPIHSGDLTISNNATVQVTWLTSRPNSYNALGSPGTTTIFMDSGSFINIRDNQNINAPVIVLRGDARILFGSSTQGPGDVSFPYGITGLHKLQVGGKPGNDITFSTTNNFAELDTFISGSSGGMHLYATVANSLPSLIKINDNGSGAPMIDLFVNAEGAMPPNAELHLGGNIGSTLITMNANCRISKLFINGVQQPNNIYDNTSSWLSGPGQLVIRSEGTLITLR